VLRQSLDVVHKICVEEAKRTLGIRDTVLAQIMCDIVIDMSLGIIISSLLCHRDKGEEDLWEEEESNYWGE